ncbi:MAG: DUF58 domain-containing protein [Spirochaetaceae bacterium]|jgi:uncharacterized protein (DUF58 family)|nr:DUF58 domain-containing protein [Spirochaetaceae bacterium]
MDRHELLRKITTFPLIAAVLAEDLLSGDFRSAFKGQGIEADEVRHYERGDDIRAIDWNVSARFGTPYVKMYREERELTVSLVLDCSASMYCGSPTRRADQGLLAATLIAFSAERAGQRVAALFFDRGIIKVFPPRKGRAHIMAMISAALSIDNGGGAGSNLGVALAGQGRLLKRRSLIVIISDFLSVQWEQELGGLCRKHDVIAIRIGEPPDMAYQGLIALEDPETGRSYHVPTGFAEFRAAWSDWHRDRRDGWQGVCRRLGASFLDLCTQDDVPAVLIRFFGSRGGIRPLKAPLHNKK